MIKHKITIIAMVDNNEHMPSKKYVAKIKRDTNKKWKGLLKIASIKIERL